MSPIFLDSPQRADSRGIGLTLSFMTSPGDKIPLEGRLLNDMFFAGPTNRHYGGAPVSFPSHVMYF